MKKITIMTPSFNEEETIAECVSLVENYFANNLKGYRLEHLIIDNASQDQTVPIIEKIANDKKHIRLIVNSRNFGPHDSPYYGILQSSGDAVIPIMADMQTPLETVSDFVDEWERVRR